MRPLSCWLHTASPQSNHPARIWQQKQDQTQKSWSNFRLWNYLIPDLTFAKTKRVILRNISVLQLEVHSSTQNFDRKKALFKIKSIANSRMFFFSLLMSLFYDYRSNVKYRFTVKPEPPETIDCVSPDFKELICTWNKSNPHSAPTKWEMWYSWRPVNGLKYR